MKAQDLSGQRFGRLTAIEDTGQRESVCKFVVWKCRCDCGAETLVPSGNLKSGHTKSCGCLFADVITKHGEARDSGATREYRIWNAMKNRCRNPNHRAFRHYGGRGITFCERWIDFQSFISDMGRCPKGLTLERKDNSKGYSPDNCKWATRSEQMRNTRRNNRVTFKGETRCLSDWALKLGVGRSALQNRLDNGWTVERTFAVRNGRRDNAHTRFITHEGVTRSLAEWSESTGLSSDTIMARIERLGWSTEKSLTTPKRYT